MSLNASGFGAVFVHLGPASPELLQLYSHLGAIPERLLLETGSPTGFDGWGPLLATLVEEEKPWALLVMGSSATALLAARAAKAQDVFVWHIDDCSLTPPNSTTTLNELRQVSDWHFTANPVWARSKRA
jgi:hypothetical protein